MAVRWVLWGKEPGPKLAVHVLHREPYACDHVYSVDNADASHPKYGGHECPAM